MINYFADRSMHIVGQASTNLPNGLKISSDTKKEDVAYGSSIYELYIPYDNETREQVEKICEVGNYILRENNGTHEVYTIIDTENETDGSSGEIYIYAEDAGLDLLNEVLGVFVADGPQKLEYYANKILYDTGFEVGINEITEDEQYLGWEDEETARERLLSLADTFECEISFTFKIEGFTLKHKYVNFIKKVGNDNGETLRLGKEITNIKIRKSITSLATALRVSGGIPEGEQNPINLIGETYDDGEDMYLENGMLKSRDALSKWSRYLAESGNNVGHIVTTFNYDTTDKDELLLAALIQLNMLKEPQVNYDVTLNEMPKNIKIGDTVRIVDNQGKLYLSSRVLELESSECLKTYKATLGDFLIQESGISDKVAELAAQYKDVANKRVFYTWVAYADTKDGAGISLDSTGKKYMGTVYNKITPTVDISDPSIFNWVLLKNPELFRSYVLSTSGLILKPGVTEQTILKANIFYGQDDISNDYTIKWYKDGSYIATGRNLSVARSTLTNDTTVFTFNAEETDGTIVTTNEVTVSVVQDGEKGDPGANGADGSSITILSNKVYYKGSTQATTPPTGTWSETVVSVPQGDYLWTKNNITYSDDTSSTTYSVSRNGVDGIDGADGQNGADGVSISIVSSSVSYQTSSQCVTPPTGTWSSSIVSTDQGTYLWTRTIVEYSDGTTTTSYSVSRNGVDGADGEKGDKGDKGDPGADGADGKGVSSIDTEYYVSTSKTELTGGSWSSDIPTWDANKYLWIRYIVTYINPEGTEYTTPFCDASWEAINNLKVSGVNLLDGTKYDALEIGTFPETGSLTGKTYYTTEPLLEEEYIVSFDAMSTVDGDVMMCYFTSADAAEQNCYEVITSQGWTNKSTSNISYGTTEITLSTTWQRYWVIYRHTPNVDTLVKRVRIGSLYSGKGTGTVSIRRVKCEVGNKATEWCLSPNDQLVIVNSDTPPTNTNVIWCDTSVTPYKLLKYNTTTREWEIVNDFSEDLNSMKESITTSYNAAIDLLTDSINTTVEELKTTISGNETNIETLKSQMEQTESSFTMMTSEIREITDEMTGMATKEEIQKWARYSNGVLVLGESDSPFSVRLSTSELGFYENDTKIAYLSNQQLHISQAVVMDKINIGNYTIESDDDKGLIIY